jgi:hypothetical protein
MPGLWWYKTMPVGGSLGGRSGSRGRHGEEAALPPRICGTFTGAVSCPDLLAPTSAFGCRDLERVQGPAGNSSTNVSNKDRRFGMHILDQGKTFLPKSESIYNMRLCPHRRPPLVRPPSGGSNLFVERPMICAALDRAL